MPIYEYRCTACGHELEKLQRMSEAVLTECPACEKPALKRLISASGFRLKGSGWYETDFKKDNKRNIVETASDKTDKTDKSEKSDKASKKDGESKSSESKSSNSGKKDTKSASAGDKKSDSTKATAA